MGMREVSAVYLDTESSKCDVPLSSSEHGFEEVCLLHQQREGRKHPAQSSRRLVLRSFCSADLCAFPRHVSMSRIKRSTSGQYGLSSSSIATSVRNRRHTTTFTLGKVGSAFLTEWWTQLAGFVTSTKPAHIGVGCFVLPDIKQKWGT